MDNVPLKAATIMDKIPVVKHCVQFVNWVSSRNTNTYKNKAIRLGCFEHETVESHMSPSHWWPMHCVANPTSKYYCVCNKWLDVIPAHMSAPRTNKLLATGSWGWNGQFDKKITTSHSFFQNMCLLSLTHGQASRSHTGQDHVAGCHQDKCSHRTCSAFNVFPL